MAPGGRRLSQGLLFALLASWIQPATSCIAAGQYAPGMNWNVTAPCTLLANVSAASSGMIFGRVRGRRGRYEGRATRGIVHTSARLS